MTLFDTHAHLGDERFEGDRDEIIAAMAREGIALCVTAGSDMDSSAASVALAGRHRGLYAAVGVHPHEASAWRDGCARRLAALAAGPKVVAIGEIGLDYHYDHSPREIQRRALAEQMALAVSLGLPAVFHVREAWGDFLPLLRDPAPAGVMHCFSGSAESARLCLDAGLYVSFAGTVTYKNARHLHEAARYVPADRLLIETDSPYLSPEPARGRRNDPRNARLVAAHIAGLRGVPAEEIARVTLENGCRLFGIPIPDDADRETRERQHPAPPRVQANAPVSRGNERKEGTAMTDTFVYAFRNALYVNLTNRCTNRCDFCLRSGRKGVGGYDLWLTEEPGAAQVLAAFGEYDLRKAEEVVFCGFGEPMLALDTLLTVARGIKALHPSLPLRVNTNGQANLYHGRDVTADMAGLIDTVSVSLNAPDAAGYDALCHSVYGPAAFEGMLDFCRRCAGRGIAVVMTVVGVLGTERIEACRALAGRAGATLRVREHVAAEEDGERAQTTGPIAGEA